MKVDKFVKVMLVVIAILLALNCATNLRGPADAQGGEAKFEYAHIGGGVQLPGGGEGQIVVDLRNGNVWGFPVNDILKGKPLDTTPTYLGRFKLEAMDNAPDKK